MFKKFQLAFGAAAVATLVACGGGGGDATTTPTPITSTDTFDLRTAYVNYVNPTVSQSFTTSGTVAGKPATGTGLDSTGILSTGIFEGVNALKIAKSSTQVITSDGQTVTVSTKADYYYDSNYNPLGYTNVSLTVNNGIPSPVPVYGVTTVSPSAPRFAKIGDSGNLHTTQFYTSSSKIAAYSSTALSYVVEPDTARTALISFIETMKVGNTVASVTTTVTRSTTTGSLTFISKTVKDFTEDSTIKAIYN